MGVTVVSEATLAARDVNPSSLASIDQDVALVTDGESVRLLDASTRAAVKTSPDLKLTTTDAPVILTSEGFGPQGIPGVGSAAPIFVQDTAPAGDLPARYLWVQTNAGPSGEGVVLWAEDGD